jgi:polypeptide N-acetylgalactosaminyltransferase
MLGAVNSRGPALIFADAHVEVTLGWLEPLLDRLRMNRNITAIPVIETIHDHTLEYVSINQRSLSITGFDWKLMFTWILIPNREKQRRLSDESPIYSPTMLGAFFGRKLITIYTITSI